MIRVRDELEDAVADQAVHGRVHALSRQTHPPSDLRDRERPVREGDRAEYLPAGGREPLVGGADVPGSQEQPVRAERRQDELRGSLSARRSLLS